MEVWPPQASSGLTARLVLSLEASQPQHQGGTEGTIAVRHQSRRKAQRPELRDFHRPERPPSINKSFLVPPRWPLRTCSRTKIDHYVACVRDGCPPLPRAGRHRNHARFSTRGVRTARTGTRSFSADERRVYKMKIGVSSYSFQRLIGAGSETQLSVIRRAAELAL